MSSEPSQTLQNQLYDLKDRLRAIRLVHVIERAETLGIRPLIESYTADILYLSYLNDLPNLLGHYGQAVSQLNTIEHHQPLPDTTFDRWAWQIGIETLLGRLKLLLNASYDAGEDLYTLYRRLRRLHLQSISTGSAAKLVAGALFSNIKRQDLKASILTMYARLCKADSFGLVVKQPLKDYCIMLLDRMEEMVGKGGVVQPDTKHLAEKVSTALFVRVPRTFMDEHLSTEGQQEVRQLLEQMTALQKEIDLQKNAEGLADG